MSLETLANDVGFFTRHYCYRMNKSATPVIVKLVLRQAFEHGTLLLSDEQIRHAVIVKLVLRQAFEHGSSSGPSLEKSDRKHTHFAWIKRDPV